MTISGDTPRSTPAAARGTRRPSTPSDASCTSAPPTPHRSSGTAEYPNGTSRPGDNLYTDSVVALDVDTGALRWYHQVTAHDLYDRDQIHTLIARLPPGS